MSDGPAKGRVPSNAMCVAVSDFVGHALFKTETVGRASFPVHCQSSISLSHYSFLIASFSESHFAPQSFSLTFQSVHSQRYESPNCLQQARGVLPNSRQPHPCLRLRNRSHRCKFLTKKVKTQIKTHFVLPESCQGFNPSHPRQCTIEPTPRPIRSQAEYLPTRDWVSWNKLLWSEHIFHSMFYDDKEVFDDDTCSEVGIQHEQVVRVSTEVIKDHKGHFIDESHLWHHLHKSEGRKGWLLNHKSYGHKLYICKCPVQLCTLPNIAFFLSLFYSYLFCFFLLLIIFKHFIMLLFLKQLKRRWNICKKTCLVNFLMVTSECLFASKKWSNQGVNWAN